VKLFVADFTESFSPLEETFQLPASFSAVREVSMRTFRICLLGTLAALALRPAVAQTADEPSQSVKTALNRISTDFTQGWNKQQPAAMAALCAKNCLYVAPTGTYTGQAGMQQYYTMMFDMLHPSTDFARTISNVQMLSDGLVMAAGHWTLSRPAVQGFWSEVYQRQGGNWVMLAHTHNISPPTPNK
jgi:uncharacterized protein (TIGR02246 family)